MATFTRRDSTPVIDMLLNEERRFGLHQAISLIEDAFGEDVTTSESPNRAPMRFRASMDFGFHGSPIESIREDRLAIKDPFESRFVTHPKSEPTPDQKPAPTFIDDEMRRFVRRLLNIPLQLPKDQGESLPLDIAHLKENLSTRLGDYYQLDEEKLLAWFNEDLNWNDTAKKLGGSNSDALRAQINTTALAESFFDFLAKDQNLPVSNFESGLKTLNDKWPKSAEEPFWQHALGESDDGPALLATTPALQAHKRTADPSFIEARLEDLKRALADIRPAPQETWRNYRHWFEAALSAEEETPEHAFTKRFLDKLRLGQDVALDDCFDWVTERAVSDSTDDTLTPDTNTALLGALALWPARSDTVRHELLDFAPVDRDIDWHFIRSKIQQHTKALMEVEVTYSIKAFMPAGDPVDLMWGFIDQSIGREANIATAVINLFRFNIPKGAPEHLTRQLRRLDRFHKTFSKLARKHFGKEVFTDINETKDAYKNGQLDDFLDATIQKLPPISVGLGQYFFLSRANVRNYSIWQIGRSLLSPEPYPITVPWMTHRLLMLAEVEESDWGNAIVAQFAAWPRRKFFGCKADGALAINRDDSVVPDVGFIVEQINLFFDRLQAREASARDASTEAIWTHETIKHLLITNTLSRLQQTLHTPLFYQTLHHHTHQSLRFSSQLEKSVRAAAEAWPKQRNRTMVVNTLSLGGSQGPLPWQVSELLLSQSEMGSSAMRDFFDVFNHRLIALAYQIKKSHRHNLERTSPDKNSFSQRLFSLLGLGLPETRNRMVLPDTALLKYAGLFALTRRSLKVLERILSDCFEVPIECCAFEGAWVDREASDTTALGGMGRLGINTPLGTRAFIQDAGYKIVIGPLPSQRYRDFLPNTQSHEALVEMARCYTSSDLDFCIELALDPNDLPREPLSTRCTSADDAIDHGADDLNDDPNPGPLLGWGAMLAHHDGREERPTDGGTKTTALAIHKPILHLRKSRRSLVKQGLFNTPFFRTLSLEEFQTVRAYMRPEKFFSEQVVYDTLKKNTLDAPQERGRALVVLVSGTTEMLKAVPSTDNQDGQSNYKKIHELGVGTVFGQHRFLEQETPEYIVKALEPVWTLRLGPSEQDELFERRPDIKRMLLDTAAPILSPTSETLL